MSRFRYADDLRVVRVHDDLYRLPSPEGWQVQRDGGSWIAVDNQDNRLSFPSADEAIAYVID